MISTSELEGENRNKKKLNILKWVNMWASHGDLIITMLDVFLWGAFY